MAEVMPVEGGTGTAVVSPAASTLRDEMAVSGQRLLATREQIPMATKRVPLQGRPWYRHSCYWFCY